MSEWPEAAEFRDLRRAAQTAAERLRLPFGRRSWRGETGGWSGTGIGSSIDFQDHRPYLPGDDPRYIDWQAYARTGHYSMKLYREEVSPRVDVALDLSASMTFDGPKRQRVFELFLFAVESGLRAGSSVRVHALAGGRSYPWTVEMIVAGRRPFEGVLADGGSWEQVPWRQGSLRVVVSDLLFPGSPDPLVSVLSAGKGRGVLLAPYGEAEADPDWGGNVEFVDCESGRQRVQNVSPSLKESYTRAYGRHFDLWKERGQRHGVLLARVGAADSLLEALRGEALQVGAVEMLS